ncbi:hypothetical protein S40288_11688 [Stachybotrys chartarum IBT 40288]|nr:hypothetical protein S40288_11688 [Stachybotrys chartarum IBT 40288]
MSIQTLLQKHFYISSNKNSIADQKIPSSLTIPTLHAKSKIYVRWTNNLLDHLSITEEKGKHTIVFYEHLICLLNHQQHPSQCAIPQAIIQEAIDTFILLFPTTVREMDATKRFLQGRGRDFFTLDVSGLGEDRKLELHHYPYWGRSIEKMMVMLERPPRGWRQAILDSERQNFEQVISIWVGTVATILTVVALGFGILSTVLAFQANRLAAEANVLARESLILGREANELARPFKKSGIWPLDGSQIISRVVEQQQQSTPTPPPISSSGESNTPTTYRQLDKTALKIKVVIAADPNFSPTKAALLSRFIKGALFSAAEGIQMRKDLSRTRYAEAVRAQRRASKNFRLKTGGVLSVEEAREMIVVKKDADLAKARRTLERFEKKQHNTAKRVFKEAARCSRDWREAGLLPPAEIISTGLGKRYLKSGALKTGRLFSGAGTSTPNESASDSRNSVDVTDPDVSQYGRLAVLA